MGAIINHLSYNQLTYNEKRNKYMIISAINKFIRLINPNLIIKLRPTNLFRSK